MRTSFLLAALVLAGCSSSRTVPTGSATLTLFGPGARLERWNTVVVEGVHIHPALVEAPCLGPALAGTLTAVSGALESPRKEQAEALGGRMGTVMDTFCAMNYGKPYGGRDRITLVLRHFGAGSTPDEALIVDLPRLKPDEAERLFKAGEFAAAFERPPKTVEAVLDRGWVRALRGGAEFELFLVLKPVAAGAPYESIQVVTRVETPAR